MATPELHECCNDARALLRAYPDRTEPVRYRWHLLGADRYVTYCPWCGAQLEELRRLQTFVTRGQAAQSAVDRILDEAKDRER